jgi:hypothetical protein
MKTLIPYMWVEGGYLLARHHFGTRAPIQQILVKTVNFTWEIPEQPQVLNSLLNVI